jgi:hypothetical protein
MTTAAPKTPRPTESSGREGEPPVQEAPRPKHKNVDQALIAFAEKRPTLELDSTNPHYGSKFTSLAQINRKVTPVLIECGLRWSAIPGFISNGDGRPEPVLSYQLVHADSGTRIEGQMLLLLSKGDPQGQGAAITYARRYSISAVLDLVSEEDDDGEAAIATAPRSQATAQPSERPATAAQRGLINQRASEKELSFEQLATIIAVANQEEPREFESTANAQAWLSRRLDRLPQRLVDEVLSGIAAHAS